MKLKLACADFSFPLLPHDQVLDLIKMIGLEGVDIGVFANRSHVRPEDVVKNIRKAAQKLSDKVRGRDLVFADIYLIPADIAKGAANHPSAPQRRKSRDLFQRILEFTVRCNAPHMSGVPGVHWESESEADSLQRSAEELHWRVEKAKEVGVVYSVEPHIGSIVPTPERAMRLVKQTPGLTLTLDYGHFTQQGIADRRVEPLVKYASHFHARGACRGRLQPPWKENTIDFARILRAMKRAKYKGFLELEYVWMEWQNCNEVDNLSETILLRDHLRAVGARIA